MSLRKTDWREGKTPEECQYLMASAQRELDELYPKHKGDPEGFLAAIPDYWYEQFMTTRKKVYEGIKNTPAWRRE